jgi:hypothetical protein
VSSFPTRVSARQASVIRHAHFSLLFGVRGAVLEREEAAVEDVGSDQFQADVGEAGEGRLSPRIAEDLREHDQPETVDQPRPHEGPDHREAADGAQRVVGDGFKRPDLLDEVARRQPAVVPFERLPERPGEHHRRTPPWAARSSGLGPRRVDRARSQTSSRR